MHDARPAAFFDIDGTLIPFNSGVRYARSEYRAGRISRAQLAQSGLWLLVYKLSLMDLTRAFEKAVQHHTGMLEAELDARTRAWFDAEIAEQLLPDAARAIAHHRDAGHPLVLLSSTSSYMARAALDSWGFDHWLANVFPTDASRRLTGAVEAPLCYGPGKVTRARAWAEAHGVDLAASYFHTDSHSDLPMLDAVGHPRVVNPDVRLRRAARRRGWGTEIWAPPARPRSQRAS